MNNPIKASISENLSGLTITPARHAQLMQNITGGTKVKKKLTASLALALILVLLAATALAAVLLSCSPQADAVAKARAALAEKYGLSPDALGTFTPHAAKEEGQWRVTFTSAFFHPSLVGEYRVLVDGKDAQASWSHDKADRAVWEKAGLESPVWGQPQISEALRNPEAAEPINAKLQRENPAPPDPYMPGPEVLEGQGEDASYWNGEIIRPGQPGPDDLTRDQALAIARQALILDFGLTEAELNANAAGTSDSFHVRESGGTLWGFSFLIEKGGVLWDCGIMLDGKTGEVLMTSIITGANE